MNDFFELETELKELCPAPLREELFARIERVLAEPETVPTAGLLRRPAPRPRAWWSVGLGLAGATALVLFGLGFLSEPSRPRPGVAPVTVRSPAAPSSGLQPSTLTQVIYRQHNEGLVFSPNQSEQLLRRVRYDTRQTMQWRDPKTGASLRVSYPAEQVVLTPVSFQ